MTPFPSLLPPLSELTHRELAAILGCSRAAARSYRDGKRLPYEHNRVRMLARLEVWLANSTNTKEKAL